MMRTALLVNLLYGCGLGASAVPYADNIAAVSGTPDDGAYDTSMQNTLEDQEWAGATHPGGLAVDNCPTVSPSNYNEPSISDVSFSPNGDSRSTSCTGLPGADTILCNLFLTYASQSPATQRYDQIYLGGHLLTSVPPGTSGDKAVGFTQSAFQSFRYSTRHVQQLASMYYGYVSFAHGENLTAKGLRIQNLLVDYGFGEDIMDPLFNADYNLADNYMSDSSSSGPYHDCYVFSSLPGASDASSLNVIGIDYYPYRSAVCSHMPDSLTTYVNCETTGCGITSPDYLYDALQARHLMNKYAVGTDGPSALTTAEGLINNICYDGVGVCINSWTQSAYSTERLGAYLSALVRLEVILGGTTTYALTGQGCLSSKGCGSSFSGLLTQRVQDVARTLSKMWIGAGPWSVNQVACGSTAVPGAFEEIGTNQVLCSPQNIGGFMVGFLPASSPYAAKNPRGGATDFAESVYCALIVGGGGSGCVNMAVENPFGTPTNAESTIVSMMGLLEYYKLVYPGDVTLSGVVDITDVSICYLNYNYPTGGNGIGTITARGYKFMCDYGDKGAIDIVSTSVVLAHYGIDYSAWDYATNGAFALGTLSGWTVAPNASDLTVVGSPVYGSRDLYSLRIKDAINYQTIVSQTVLNPTILYGQFAASFAFYLPNLPDLGRASVFPALVVDYGSYEFFLQPSSIYFNPTMYDCYRVSGSGSAIAGCFPGQAFSRNDWNIATVTRDANGNVAFYINGALLGNVVGTTDTVTFLSFYIQQCGSLYLSQPNVPSCGTGTTPDYYYVDAFSLLQVE